MLSKAEFGVLVVLAAEQSATQRVVAEKTGVSLGSVNKIVKRLRETGRLDQRGRLTAVGRSALEPYRVCGAVALAAGVASRFAPLSFERPRAMFEVRGEVLVERLIRQLKENGIDDITVVVGYMKEAFFYLEDEFGVKIVVNEEYATRNNSYSLWCARDGLSNAYVCSADQYYSCNIFEPYVFESYCSAVQNPGDFGGLVLTLDKKGYVTDLSMGGHDALCMQGPVYFDHDFLIGS